MSRSKTKDELMGHKASALQNLSDYLESLIESENPKLMGKADKLSYWIKDWINFLDFEPNFSPKSLRRYKRGEIIKVHLGFNVGSEEGGLHYAVVIDKDNSKNSPIVTIVPLTSVKPNTNVDNLHRGNIFLGNELFTNLSSKYTSAKRSLTTEVNFIMSKIDSGDCSENDLSELRLRVNEATEKLKLINKISREISQMKRGSIALTCQVTTISKIRIYDPKTNMDVLSNIKLSNEKLDLIDQSIKELFIK